MSSTTESFFFNFEWKQFVVHVKCLFWRKVRTGIKKKISTLLWHAFCGRWLCGPLDHQLSPYLFFFWLRAMLMSSISNDTIKAEDADHKRTCQTLTTGLSRMWQQDEHSCDIPRVSSGSNIKLCWYPTTLFLGFVFLNYTLNVEVKIPYLHRPEQALRVPRGWSSRSSRQSTFVGG